MQIINKRTSGTVLVWTNIEKEKAIVPPGKATGAVPIGDAKWLNIIIEDWKSDEPIRITTSLTGLDLSWATGKNLDKFEFSLPISKTGDTNAGPDDNITIEDDDTGNPL